MRLVKSLCAVLMICFLCGTLSFAQDEFEQEAELAYLANDYTKSIELLTLLLEEDGRHTATIYHNLGNAYYALTDYPAALLNYRRAQRLNPRNPTLQQQIALLKAQLGQTSSASDDSSLLVLVQSFTLDELALFAFCTWSLVWILASATLMRPNLRSQLTPIMAISALVFIAGAGLMTLKAYDTLLQPSAVIMQDAVVRSGPDERYPSIYTLPAARDIHITQQQDDWIRFTTDEGRIGWTLKANIERINSPDTIP